MNSSTVTIILPVSREEYLNRIFASLELLDCSGVTTNLLVIVDSKDENLFVKTRNFVEESKFKERLCVLFEDSDGDKDSILVRRLRISAIHNQFKKELNILKSKLDIVHYVFGIEDDTLVPEDSLKKLLKGYSLNKGVGFIEGVELGRWGATYVGAWKCDDIYNPTRILSLSEQEASGGLQAIDSGGFYCFLTKLDTYLEHEFKPYENNALGPDADFGLSLRRNGYQNYIDTSIQCVHLDGENRIFYPKDKIQQIEVYKIGQSWFQRLAKS